MNVLVRTMTPNDIPHGMRLKAQNGWNQLEADWRRQLELEPTGCFLAECDGQPIGTACACVFGPVAWVAMVLVDAEQRGRGIGTLLMKHVLDYLDERRVPSIRLDATPLGQPVYEKLGFVAEFGLQRFEGTPTIVPPHSHRVQPVSLDDLPAVFELDRRVTGTPRLALLERLFGARHEEFRQVRGPDGIEGFLAARPGARAWQVGPCLGAALACRALLLDFCGRHAGAPVFLDIPDAHHEAQALAREIGLSTQRPLLRMGRGTTIKESLEMLWTTFGPEKG